MKQQAHWMWNLSELFHDALVRISTDRTTIIVSQRMSTVKSANTISVVHHRKIIEQGSHSDLLKDPNGAYSKLISMREIGKQAEEGPLVDPADILVRSEADKSGSHTMSPCHGSGRFSLRLSYIAPDDTTFQEGAIGDHESNKSENVIDKKPQNGVSVRRLAYLNKPELPIFVLGSVAAAMHGVIAPLFGVMLSSAIKIFYEPPDELQKDAQFWALMYVLLGIISLLIERIRYMTFERVVHQEISWFDEASNSRFVCLYFVSSLEDIFRELHFQKFESSFFLFSFISAVLGARLSGFFYFFLAWGSTKWLGFV